MFRKNGFLNLLQLMIHSTSNAEIVVPDSDSNDRDFLESTRQYSSLYTFRYMIEKFESLYLFKPGLELVEVDTDVVLAIDERLVDFEADFVEPLTSEYLRKASVSLIPDWPMIDLDVGAISIPKRNIFSFEPEAMMLRKCLSTLRPFNGFSVLLSESEVIAEQETLNQAILQRLKNRRSRDSSSPSLENVMDCFREAFPGGKGQATWAEVEAKTGYSRRTINRALNRFGGQSLWARGGQ